MKKLVFLIPVFVFRLITLECTCAQIGFFNLDAESGLTSLEVNCIAQDDDGFIWVGTTNGLFRYDGNNFIPFKHQINNPRSLSNDNITCIFLDSRNRLWIATRDGLNLYNKFSQDFNRFLSDDKDTGTLKNNLVSTIYEDDKGNIWLGHYDGISKIQEKNNSFRFENYTVKDTGSNIENWIVTICQVGNNELLLGGQYRGLFKVNTETKSVKNYYDSTRWNEDFSVAKIYKDDQNKIWVACRKIGGLLEYHPETDSFLDFNFLKKLENQSIVDIYQDENQNLWVCLNIELLKLNESLKPIKNNNFSYNKLINASSPFELKCIFHDQSGVMWIGTAGQGIFGYCEPSIHTEIIKGSSFSSISANKILQLRWVNSALYFVPGNGYLHELKNGSVRNLDVERSYFPILYDNQSRVYSGKGFYDFVSGAKGEITTYKKLQNYYINEDGIINMFIDGRIEKIDQDGNIIERNDIILDQVEGMNYGIGIKIKNALPDGIYFLSADGLYIMSEQNYVISKVFHVNDMDGHSYNFNDFDIYKNTAWIISEHLLIGYNRDKNEYQVYNQDKLFGDVIYSVLCDEQGDVWFAGNKGIVLLDTDREKLYLFDKSNGIPGYNFTDANCLAPENVIYFGSNDGIIRLEKSTFKENDYLPPIVFTNFQLFNKDVPISPGDNSDELIRLEKPINELDKIELNYRQNFFSIEYAALNYAYSSKNQYSYKLEGLENDWNQVGNQLKASYNGVPPGEYKFLLKASNNDGVWSDKIRSLEIIIHPPFWQTTWFKILLMLGALSFVMIIFMLRIRAINLKKKELEKLVRLRTAEIVAQKDEIESQAENLREINILLRENQEEVQAQAEELFEANTELQKLNNTKDKFFSIIAHDLKNPFQAINGFSEVLLKDFDKLNKDKAKEFISIIKDSSKTASGLLENLLEWARSQTNRIDFKPEGIKIDRIAEETISLLQVNARNKKIELKNKIPENLVVFADKNMVTTVLRNLVNNAIKFTPEGGEIELLGSKKEAVVEITVSDSGVGMDDKTMAKLFRIENQLSTTGTSGEAGTGLGLIVVQEFIEKNNGSISVKSEPGKGSQFIILLPEAEGVEVETEDKEVIRKPEEIRNETPRIEETKSVQSEEKPLLLIAEDTLDIRQGIKAYLEDMYRIIEAGDGEEGLKYALKLIPDLIITDWMMPNMDGIEFCRQLKSKSATSHIPVVMLTAKSTPTNKIEGFETGADDYMVKPFDYAVLKVRVKNLIRSRIDLQKKYSAVASEEEEQIKLNKVDQQFMDRITNLIDQNIDNSEFVLNDYEQDLAMSRSQIYRKIKAITGQSPTIFIRNFRLKIAAKKLKNSGETIAEIMYSVGFSNTSYFARSFREVFGCSPKEFQEK